MIVKAVERCPKCGTWVDITVNPAAMLGSAKKTMTPAAIQQRVNASKKAAEKKMRGEENYVAGLAESTAKKTKHFGK